MKHLLLPTLLIALLAVGFYFFYPTELSQPPAESGESSLVEGEIEKSEEPLKPSPEELLQQQRLIEHARPQEFIEVKYETKKNLLGESIIEGTFLNQSEMTTYRDVQLMIYFQNENGVSVDSASQMVFEVLERGVPKEFRLKERGPKKTKAVLNIGQAKVVPEK